MPDIEITNGGIIQLHTDWNTEWTKIHVYLSMNILLQTGESLVDGAHYASDEIETQVEELFQKWEELREATENKGVGLEQALSLVQFNRKVDGVQVLVRDRVAVASSQETGRDLEHCQVLMKKFDDFQKVRTLL